MKRFVLSSALALLMTFSLSAEARAEEFCALGSYSAGSELNCYIAHVPTDAVVSAEGLPEGLYLAEIPDGDTKGLSLQGKAMQAGNLDFSINVSEEPELINCSAEFVAAQPSVSLSSDVSCAVGEAVTLELQASAPDGGSLSVQWYSGETADPEKAIIGANGFSFSPDTSSPGIFSYCCSVTNTNNGSVNSVVTTPVYVTVAEAVITGIQVETMPRKLSYRPGESLDAAGLSIRLLYDNGSYQILDSGFEASPAVFEKPGVQQVELRYAGFSCHYDVDVSISQQDIEGIGVLTLPEKTEYKVGESFQPEGLSIRVYTPSGHFDVSEDLKCSPETLNGTGRQSITVEYAGHRCSFTVTVKDDNQLKSIDIASLPAKREYRVGDRLDTSGLSIQLIYGNKTELVTSGFSCTPEVLSHSGPQTITVSYAGHSASFSIFVKEADSKPSPTPAANSSASPAPSESSAPTSASPKAEYEHQARELGGLVKVIFAVALLSLAALGAYVFYMAKKGKK